MDLSRLFSSGAARQPAAADVVHQARLAFGGSLPRQIEALYAAADGFMTSSGITVYGAEDLVERNETFEIEEFSPGYLLIGDNSGGMGFLVARNGPDEAVYSSDLGDLDIKGFRKLADSMAQWIAVL
jgi:hypothetical protein